MWTYSNSSFGLITKNDHGRE